MTEKEHELVLMLASIVNRAKRIDELGEVYSLSCYLLRAASTMLEPYQDVSESVLEATNRVI
jgi:hypothetical protein